MKFKEKVERLQRYYHSTGVIPTFEEMTELFGATSKNVAAKFMRKALAEGYFKKLPPTSRYAPRDKFFI